jgi:hypothetical protein
MSARFKGSSGNESIPYTKLQLNIMASSCPTCNCGEVTLTAGCGSETFVLVYSKKTGLLTAKCSGCGKVTAQFKIAEN